GELVVIDTGCNVGGYVSDYTRTLATGELDAEMHDAYDTVLAAQQAGLDAIRSGETGLAVDAAARGVIEGSDFAGTFGHGLGTASASTFTKRRGSPPRARTRSRRATSSRSSRASTSRAASASGSRTTSS